MRTISKMLYKFLSNNFDDELGTETSEKGQNLAKFGVHIINYQYSIKYLKSNWVHWPYCTLDFNIVLFGKKSYQNLFSIMMPKK